MAINHTNLFTALGKIIKAGNYLASTYATQKTNRDAIYTQLNTQGVPYLGSDLSDNVSSQISGLSGGIAYFQQKAQQLLSDETLVCSQLPLLDRNVSSILRELYRDMVDQTVTINRGITAFGTITSDAITPSGTIDGIIVKTTNLDGKNVPVEGGISNPYYNSALSELGAVGTIYVVCTDNSVEGAEQFLVYGSNGVLPFQEMTEAPGGSTSLSGVFASSKLTDGQFEVYSSGFTNWTITPTSTTVVAQETSAPFRGSSALKLTTFAGVTIEQNLVNVLDTDRMYLAGFKWMIPGSSTVNLTLTLSIKSLDGATTYSSMNSTSGGVFGGSWLTFGGVLTGLQLPSHVDLDDVKVVLAITVNSGSAATLWLDDLFLTEATYFNGVGVGVAPGQTPFEVGDRFNIPLTRTGGVIQEWFRKTWGVQMPSSGSPSLADSLAT